MNNRLQAVNIDWANLQMQVKHLSLERWFKVALAVRKTDQKDCTVSKASYKLQLFTHSAATSIIYNRPMHVALK